MATKKKAAGKSAKAKSPTVKAPTEVLSKSGLVSHVANASGV